MWIRKEDQDIPTAFASRTLLLTVTIIVLGHLLVPSSPLASNSRRNLLLVFAHPFLTRYDDPDPPIYARS
jgi:hypothetical protein